MMPWDFGIINALKKQLEYPIFPAIPPKDMQNEPYIVLEFGQTEQHGIRTLRINLKITVYDRCSFSNQRFKILHKIQRTIQNHLVLCADTVQIGIANFKQNTVENLQNTLILKLTGEIKLNDIYNNDEVNDE